MVYKTVHEMYPKQACKVKNTLATTQLLSPDSSGILMQTMAMRSVAGGSIVKQECIQTVRAHDIGKADTSA